MSEPTVPDVLTAAAAIIRRNGWHTGSYFRSEGELLATECPVCLLGAIGVATKAAPGLWEEDQVGIDAALAVAEFIGVGMDLAAEQFYLDDVVDVIGGWNDSAERTVDEVLAALEGAAQAERERAAT